MKSVHDASERPRLKNQTLDDSIDLHAQGRFRVREGGTGCTS